MGLYGSLCDYVIHVGLISTRTLLDIMGLDILGRTLLPSQTVSLSVDCKQQTQLVRASKNDFIIVRRREAAHCYQEYTIISEECFTKVLEVFE